MYNRTQTGVKQESRLASSINVLICLQAISMSAFMVSHERNVTPITSTKNSPPFLSTKEGSVSPSQGRDADPGGPSQDDWRQENGQSTVEQTGKGQHSKTIT